MATSPPRRGQRDQRVIAALEQAGVAKAKRHGCPITAGAVVRVGRGQRLWAVVRVHKVADGRLAELREVDGAGKKTEPFSALTVVRGSLTPHERYDVLRLALPEVDPEGDLPDEHVETSRRGRCLCGKRHPRISSSVDRDRIRTALTWKVHNRISDIQAAALRLIETKTLDFRKLADHISVTELADDAEWPKSKLGQALRELAEIGVIEYLSGTGYLNGDAGGTLLSWVRIRVPLGWADGHGDDADDEAEGVPDEGEGVLEFPVPGVTEIPVPGVPEVPVPPVPEIRVPGVPEVSVPGVPEIAVPSHESTHESSHESDHQSDHEAAHERPPSHAADAAPLPVRSDADSQDTSSGDGRTEAPTLAVVQAVPNTGRNDAEWLSAHPPTPDATSKAVVEWVAAVVSVGTEGEAAVRPGRQRELAAEVDVLRRAGMPMHEIVWGLGHWGADREWANADIVAEYVQRVTDGFRIPDYDPASGELWRWLGEGMAWGSRHRSERLSTVPPGPGPGEPF